MTKGITIAELKEKLNLEVRAIYSRDAAIEVAMDLEGWELKEYEENKDRPSECLALRLIYSMNQVKAFCEALLGLHEYPERAIEDAKEMLSTWGVNTERQ